MRFAVLATDYDGTLASQGNVDEATVAALRRFRASGRALILVTGRELTELLGVFPDIDLFDQVVAENGALLYCPATGAHRVLGEPAPPRFVRELIRRGVAPVAVGRSIVATVTPHETTVLAVVRDLGLELQVIFNKGAVMVLPAGVNKATGLAVALEEMKLSLRNTVAIGDAENDHAMLRAAEFGVAVANALPALKDEADHVSTHPHAGAVIETMQALVDDDLATLGGRTPRRRISLGTLRDGTPVALPAAGGSLLAIGSAAGEAEALLADLVERLDAEDYQCCVVDVAGRYGALHGATSLGRSHGVPAPDEVAAALADDPTKSVVADFSGAAPQVRTAALAELEAGVFDLRARTGRPHWCVLPAAAASQWRSSTDGMGLAFAAHHGELSAVATRVATADAIVTLGSRAEALMQACLERRSASDDVSRAADDGGARANEEFLLWLSRLEQVFVLRPLR